MTMETQGIAAKQAAGVLRTASTEIKNRALEEMASQISSGKEEILEANKLDIEGAKTSKLTAAQIDRLSLTPERIDAIVSALKLIKSLDDPVGKQISQWSVPSGLGITRVRVPLGVIGIIYESRPNVTADAAALCIKSGNCCILRPGTESFLSSQALAGRIRKGLLTAGLPANAVQMVETSDRELVGEMLRLDRYIDVIIPRGGKSLVARVREESKVPVLAHLDGNCHVYIDGAADLEMAKKIVLNAKMRRTGICGAAEKMLIDKACAATHLQPLVQMLLEAGCEVRGDALACTADHRVKAAQDDDWATEYLDAIIAVKVVQGVKEAIEHIERYGSHHTDSIVTNNKDAANEFLNKIDSAIVMHNASTQFADGGEFGMGAEIGIATGRLHARGPVGLEELTTYKNVVYGNGHIRK